MTPEPLLQGYRRFRTGQFAEQSSLYETLNDGQSPHTLVISCSDSRVDPAAIFNAQPGELFVVRNVANLVPPVDGTANHLGVTSALEYAVKVLGVQTVLVLGHAQCGGVAACAAGIENLPDDMKFVGPWLKAMLPARADVMLEHGNASPSEQCDALELHSVRHSVERLKGVECVAEAMQSRGLEVHGARFGIGKGQLEWMDADGQFVALDV